VTKGTWLPDRSKATDKDPPLYLHIVGTTQEICDAGVAAVEKLLASDLGPLVTNFRDRQREEQPRERRKWPEERIPVGLESLRNFNIRAKIVGPQGLFVKHIQQETGARVQIKGVGSGFIESDTGRESDEPMHVHISGPEQIMVDQAKDLADDLLVVVREKWAEAKYVLEGGQPAAGGYGGYQPPPPSYGAPPPPDGSYPPAPPGQAPPPPVSRLYDVIRLELTSYVSQPDGMAPPPPPGGAAAPSGDIAAIVAQAQAMAPTIDRSILEFYAGHSQDPATIVYYAQLALHYQQQGYQGDAAAAGGAPAASTAAQMQTMNAYGTPTQSYAPQDQTTYQQPYGQQPPPPQQQQYGGYQAQSQQSPSGYGQRQGAGSYAAMPPPPGL
jgi:hypothetical protein